MSSVLARADEPSMAELHEYFEYAPDIGRLVWKAAITPTMKRMVGKIAGCRQHYGYRQISFKGAKYKEHRLIWIYHYGDIPKGKTPDHINYVRDDNRICNLRLLTDRQQNYMKHSLGIVKKKNRWHSSLGSRSRGLVHLGCFKVALLARLAYERAIIKRDPVFNSAHFLESIDRFISRGRPVSSDLLSWLAEKCV